MSSRKSSRYQSYTDDPPCEDQEANAVYQEDVSTAQDADPDMFEYASTASAPQSHRKQSSSSRSRNKSDDWSKVSDPEERRRIQNRIAQRKFRFKTREQKEKSERDSRNQEYAGSSYTIPDADDLGPSEGDTAPSGLPWGGVNMRYVVGRGQYSSAATTANYQSGAAAAVAADGGSRSASGQHMYSTGGESHYLSPDMSYHPSGGDAAYAYPTSWDGQEEGDDQLYYEHTPTYQGYDTYPYQS